MTLYEEIERLRRRIRAVTRLLWVSLVFWVMAMVLWLVANYNAN